MKLSYSAAWDDLTALLKAHGTLIAALAGVFIFLPTLLLGYLLPRPEVSNAADFLPALNRYYAANWHWFIASGIVTMLGSLAILLLVFAPKGTSVGGAISRAALFLPFYFLVSLMTGFLLGVAMLFLIVPGLYLFGRLAILGPVMVAEGRKRPLDVIGRTFEVTKGNGWRVLGFFVLVAIAGYVAAGVVNTLFGILFVLAAGKDLGGLLAMIVASATYSALAVVFLLLYAAVYRQLAGRGAAETFA
jgi:hypothetical protein